MLFLRPYGPELNPVGRTWEYARERHFGNDVFPGLDAVEDRLFEGLCELVQRPDVVKPLTKAKV